jgi:hypothetical protein
MTVAPGQALVVSPRTRDKLVDWPRVKAIYFERNLERDRNTPYTLKMLAAEVNVAHGSIRDRASKEKWTDELRAASLKRSEHAIDAARERAAFDEAEVRIRHQIIGKLLIAKSIERLKNLDVTKLTLKETVYMLTVGVEMERAAVGMGHEYVPAVSVAESGEYETPQVKMDRQKRLRELAAKLLQFLGSEGVVSSEPLKCPIQS